MGLLIRIVCDNCELDEESAYGGGYGIHEVWSEPVVCPTCRAISTVEYLEGGRSLDDLDGELSQEGPGGPAVFPRCASCGELAEWLFHDMDEASIGEEVRCPCCEVGSMSVQYLGEIDPFEH